jgi:hypothetical protein
MIVHRDAGLLGSAFTGFCEPVDGKNVTGVFVPDELMDVASTYGKTRADVTRL